MARLLELALPAAEPRHRARAGPPAVLPASASTRASGACSRRWWRGSSAASRHPPPIPTGSRSSSISSPPTRRRPRRSTCTPSSPERVVIEHSVRARQLTDLRKDAANEGRHHGPDRGRRLDARVEHVRLVADGRGGIRGRRAGDGPVDRDALGRGPSRGRRLLRGGAPARLRGRPHADGLGDPRRSRDGRGLSRDDRPPDRGHPGRRARGRRLARPARRDGRRGAGGRRRRDPGAGPRPDRSRAAP